jgi:hypothetical protein
VFDTLSEGNRMNRIQQFVSRVARAWFRPRVGLAPVAWVSNAPAIQRQRSSVPHKIPRGLRNLSAADTVVSAATAKEAECGLPPSAAELSLRQGALRIGSPLTWISGLAEHTDRIRRTPYRQGFLNRTSVRTMRPADRRDFGMTVKMLQRHIVNSTAAKILAHKMWWGMLAEKIENNPVRNCMAQNKNEYPVWN